MIHFIKASFCSLHLQTVNTSFQHLRTGSRFHNAAASSSFPPPAWWRPPPCRVCRQEKVSRDGAERAQLSCLHHASWKGVSAVVLGLDKRTAEAQRPQRARSGHVLLVGLGRSRRWVGEKHRWRTGCFPSISLNWTRAGVFELLLAD